MLTKSQAPPLDRFDRVLHGAVAGDDDGDDVGIAFDGGFDDGGAVDAGQTQVGDDDVEGEVGETGDGGLARLGLLDVVAAVGQLLGDGLAQRRLVFNQQQMFCRVSHLPGRQYFDTSQRGCPEVRGSRLASSSSPCSDGCEGPIHSSEANSQVERKTISIMKACELVGVSRRTIYNWLSSGKIEYVRTAGGSVRIFVDTLWRDPHRSDRPAVDAVWEAEGRTRA